MSHTTITQSDAVTISSLTAVCPHCQAVNTLSACDYVATENTASASFYSDTGGYQSDCEGCGRPFGVSIPCAHKSLILDEHSIVKLRRAMAFPEMHNLTWLLCHVLDEAETSAFVQIDDNMMLDAMRASYTNPESAAKAKRRNIERDF